MRGFHPNREETVASPHPARLPQQMDEATEQRVIETGEEVIYFVAVRTTAARKGAEVQEALDRLAADGLLARAGTAEDPDPAQVVAWVVAYADLLGSPTHTALQALGLDNFDHRNLLATVATEPPTPADSNGHGAT